jgi:hypothetical protein
MEHRAEDLPLGDPVKRCTCCGHTWSTLDAFLGDSQLEVAGYQVNFTDLVAGLFLFNHLACGSTIAVPVGFFRDLYDGPIYARRATGTADCPEYCLYVSELGACLAQCECAYVREILQTVRQWPKAGKSPA